MLRGSELRLALIITSQGSSALSRVGNDLRRLQAQTNTLNRNQVAELGRLATQKQKVASLSARASKAEFAASAQNIRNLKQQAKLVRELNRMGYRGAVLDQLLRGMGQARSFAAQQRIDALKALRLDEQRLGVIHAQNAALRVQIGEETALASRIATAGMAEAARLDAMQTRLARLQQRQVAARTVSHVGRAATFGGLIATAGFAGASGSFAGFDRQATLAATQTRQAGQDFQTTADNADLLRGKILELMQVFPASAEEMSKAAYDIFSSIDVNFGGGIKLLRQFNKVAVAGGVDLDRATDVSITVLQNFDEQLRTHGRVTETTGKIMERMFSIVRFGRLTFDEFGSVMENVAPAALGARQSIDDVAGAIAFLSRTLGPEKAGVGLARLFDVFLNPAFQAGMKKAGVAITDTTGKLLPLPEIIDRIAALDPDDANNIIRVITAFGEPGTKGMTGFIQARRALTLLTEGVQAYRNVQGLTVSDNDEFTQSFEAMSNTLGIRWQVMLNQLRVLVLYIGESAIPVLLEIGETIGEWIDKWQSLSENTRDNIVQWGVIISVGSVLGGLILSLVGSIISLSAELAGLSGQLGGTGGVLTRLTAFLTTMRGLASIGAIVIGIKLMQEGGNWDTIGKILLAAGVGGALGGRRGAIVAGTVAIGVELQQKGPGWSGPLANMLMGAGIGFAAGGPKGAIVGAIAAPVVMEIRKNQQIADQLERIRDVQEDIAEIRGLDEGIANRLMGQLQGISREQGIDAGLSFVEGFIEQWRTGTKKMIEDGHEAFRELPPVDKKLSIRDALKQAKSFTEIMDIIENQTKDTADNTEKMAVNIARAVASGNLAKANKIIGEFMKKQDEVLTKGNIAKKIADAVKSGDLDEASRLLNEYHNQIQDRQRESEQAADDAAKRTQDRNKAIAESTRKMTEDIQEAGRKLTDMYKDLENANKTAFGDLFQGPVMQGPIGQLFEDLKKFGVAPPIDLLTKDLAAQNEQFARMQQNISNLQKRGLPPAFLEQIRAMGPDAALFLESLRRASPGALNSLVKEWERAQKAIDEATKRDMDSKLKMWENQGKAFMQAMILGIKRESDVLDQFFINYINKKFPNLLKQAAKEGAKKFEEENPPKGRQHGGPVVPGVTYRVGEMGPELLRFDRPGRITPSTRGSGPATTTTQHTEYNDNIVIHADGASPEAVQRALRKRNFELRTKYQK